MHKEQNDNELWQLQLCELLDRAPIELGAKDIQVIVKRKLQDRIVSSVCRRCNGIFEVRYIRFRTTKRCPKCRKEILDACLIADSSTEPALRYFAMSQFFKSYSGELCKQYGWPTEDELREMPYKDFLSTPYWKNVRDYTLFKQKKCQLCYSRDKLHVHHKTYEHRGSEWDENSGCLDSLIVLCSNCHAKFHNLKVVNG